ncbi:MAG: serine hydrolase [Ignavibacteria bacterium]|nr:serine hydrolase [Ignavibacteria bacterium]
MIKSKFFLILLVTIFFLKNSLADNYADKLSELMNQYDKSQLFSGVVLLAKDGNILYEKSFGFADWESKVPNNNQTLFNTASITKMFTMVMIKQLESESKLNLADPLNKYVQMYPDETGSKITIKMLLEMKAGLGDYLMHPEYNRNMAKFTTVDAYIELIKNEPLLFEPGTRMEYSNSGYVVLGAVIEKATGKSYAQNLKDRIFNPLGMKNSYFRQMNDKLENCAISAKVDFSGGKHNMLREASPSPAGGIFTNAEDLLKFDAYLKQTKYYYTGVRAGGTPGWNAIYGQYKDGYTLIILSNFARMAEEVESRFSKILKNENYREPAEPMAMSLYKILKSEGADGLKNNLKNILEENNLEYNDMHLNEFGYQLMQSGDLDMAIVVFKLNSELFPDIANTYDSLAEAYMSKGSNELAIENYKKVLAIRPQNENAKKMIEQLSK